MSEEPKVGRVKRLWGKITALWPAKASEHLSSDEAFGAEWVAGRHGKVREWWTGAAKTAPKGLVGLALSGGGIRSATFSLGLLQALAKTKPAGTTTALGKIDILSTVSGGSYIGCFLRSLFLPSECRGINKPPPPDTAMKVPAEVKAQKDFALRVLASPAGRKLIEGPDNKEQICNPLWWLREHSRYLAPNGPTDYGYAAAYISRNWLAMMYVIAIGLALPLALAMGFEGLLRQGMRTDLYDFIATTLRLHAAAPVSATDCTIQMHSSGAINASIACQGGSTTAGASTIPAAIGHHLSPLVALAVIPLSVSLSLGMAYWLTAGMSTNEREVANQKRSFFSMVRLVGSIGAIFLALLAISLPWDLSWNAFGWTIRPALLHLPISPNGWIAGAGGLVFVWLEIAFGLVFFWWVERALTRLGERTDMDQQELLTAELRRYLTDIQAKVNWLTLVFLAIGLVESAGAYLRAELWNGDWRRLASGAILPALAFLFKKLPDWFGGGKSTGTGGKLVSRFLPAIAAVVGVALYATLAILVDAVIQAALWKTASWGEPDWRTFGVMSVIVGILVLLTGRTVGFLNLSSWHNLYASRLTRAYLGATNIDRLRSIASKTRRDITIRDNHVLDYIQPDVYGRLVLPAPLHIINVTVNRTVDPSSQIVARDRKGEPVWVEPGGVAIGGAQPAFLPWTAIGKQRLVKTSAGPEIEERPEGAETLSLGQWCSISGAAASSGMGRQTSLGYALLMSFANVRLGYWWYAPQLSDAALRDSKPNAALSEQRDVVGNALLAPKEEADHEEGKKAENPLRIVQRFWQAVLSKLPTFTFLYNELTARYSRAYVRQYLSDGGHFENSGAYALIRRRVPLILVSDNGQDPDYAFSDLETLVRLVRLDFDGEVAILEGDPLKIFLKTIGYDAETGIFVDPEAEQAWKAKLKEGDTKAFALALEVTFADGGSPVHLVWIKPRLMAGLPEDVAGYASSHPDFPQQTTGDQFFDEAQWESYRRLGEEEMTRLLKACPKLFPAQA